MFYYKTGLVRRVRIHPKYVGGEEDIRRVVRRKAREDIQNSFTPETGYNVLTIGITDVGDGYCLPLLGFVEYPVTFEAVLLYPVVGEVLVAKVVGVSESCILFHYACVFGVVRSYSLNDQDYYKYEEKEVSTTEGCLKQGVFRSQVNSEKVIEEGCAIKLRILKRTLGGNGFFLIGTMFGEFLGPVSEPIPPSIFSPTKQVEDIKPEFSQLVDIPTGIIPGDELRKMLKSEPADLPPQSSPPLSNIVIKTEPLSPTP